AVVRARPAFQAEATTTQQDAVAAAIGAANAAAVAARTAADAATAAAHAANSWSRPGSATTQARTVRVNAVSAQKRLVAVARPVRSAASARRSRPEDAEASGPESPPPVRPVVRVKASRQPQAADGASSLRLAASEPGVGASVGPPAVQE
ncbi:unnamed protein product, partial [Polarella glacialis]